MRVHPEDSYLRYLWLSPAGVATTAQRLVDGYHLLNRDGDGDQVLMFFRGDEEPLVERCAEILNWLRGGIAMGRIIKRGTKAKPRFYLKYVDADGVDRTRAAKGAFTSAQARVMLAEIERRVMNGKIGIAEPTEEQKARASLTVRQLGEKFIAEYNAPKVKNLKKYRERAAGILESRVYGVLELGDRLAASVRVVDVEKLRDALAGDDHKYEARTVINTLACISKMYTWGRRQGYVDCENPARGVERPRRPPSLDYLSKLEVARLLEAAKARAAAGATHTDRMLAPMISTALHTGMRKGELFGLRWIDVHLDAKRIDVNRSYEELPKSGKPRHLAGLSLEVLRVLRVWKEACPATSEGLVFPVEDEDTGELRMGIDWDALGLAELLAGAKCHVPKHPWHCLRHTMASHFVMAGGNILALQKILGHADLTTTLVYAHLAPDYIAGELGRLSFTTGSATVTDIGDGDVCTRDGEETSHGVAG